MISERPGATQGRPRSHADGPRTGPERLKTAPRGLQRSSEAPRHARDRFPSDSGPILEPPGPRKTSKSAVLSTNFEVFAISPGSLQQRPKKLQKEPPGSPNEPQAPPGTPRSAPRGAHDHPGAPQERTQGAPSRPDASREPFGSPFWPHLGAPGASFSSLLGVLFEPRARPARQTKALFEITGQKVCRDRCGPDVQRPLST